jgi:hypothetical protein
MRFQFSCIFWSHERVRKFLLLVYCEFCLAAYVGRTSRALPTYALSFVPISSQFFYKFNGPECKFSFPESFGHIGGSSKFYKNAIFGLYATFLATEFFSLGKDSGTLIFYSESLKIFQNLNRLTLFILQIF